MKVSYLCANTYVDPAVLRHAQYPYPPRLYDRDVGGRSVEATFRVARAAEDSGFDWVSVSEHHFAPGIMAPNAMVLASALSQVVQRVKIAVLGPVISTNNPVRIAEEISLLDAISGGRAIVFLLRGTPEEFKTYYMDPVESRERAHEAIALIERALTEPEPFGWQGRYFYFPTVSVWPRAAQTPHPPLFSSGNSEESTIFSAHHRHALAISFIPPDLVLKAVQLYLDEAKSAGWQPSEEDLLYRSHIILGEDEEDVQRQLLEYRFDPETVNARAPKGFGPLSWMDHPDRVRSGDNGAIADMDASARAGQGFGTGSLQFCGTPDQVYEQILHFHELTGVGVLDLLFQSSGGPDAVERRIRLFGSEVLPRIRGLSGGLKSVGQTAAVAG